MRKTTKKLSSILVCLFLLTTMIVQNVGLFDISANTYPTAPAMPVANEVVYTEESTANVSTAAEFIDAFKNNLISKIVFSNDIVFSRTEENALQVLYLSRSLQVDGNGFSMSLENSAAQNDYSGFKLNRTTEPLTVHFLNIDLKLRGRNFIDNYNLTDAGKNWQIILENADFGPTETGNQVQRVIVGGLAHVFLRGKVTMVSNAENFYIGQITVEENAEIYGEANFYNFSTWWFNNAGAQGDVNIGPNASVKLKTLGGIAFPAIYQHYTGIYIHKGASYIAEAEGNAVRFDRTSGVNRKFLYVFEDASIALSSRQSQPIMEWNTPADVYSAPGSEFYLIGKSVSNLNTMVRADFAYSVGSSLVLNSPLRYDIRNDNSRYKAFNVRNDFRFEILNSDIETWNAGNLELDKNPDNSNFLATLLTLGTKAIEGTTPELLAGWDTNNYARITGLNTHPELTFDEITDAHKTFSVNASVLGKSSWANQVQITAQNGDYKTEGPNGADGKYTFTTDDFFKAGTEFTATGYRGIPYWTTLNTAKTIVKDVTPPTPAVVPAKILEGTATISGTGEIGSIVSITVNGVKQNISATVDAEGKFTLDTSSVNLVNGDIVRVYLQDAAGNINPDIQTQLHQATFEPASSIEVVKKAIINAPEFIEIELNGVYDVTANVEGFDSKGNSVSLGTGAFDIQHVTNVDTSSVGVYSTEYTMQDSADPSQIAKATTKVIVKDANTVIDYENDYIISASHFKIHSDDVDVEMKDAQLRDKTGVFSFRISDGKPLYPLVKNDSSYSSKVGGYVIEFTTAEISEVSKKIVASVYSSTTMMDDNYMINANDFYIHKSKVQGEEDFFNAEYGDIYAWHRTDVDALATIAITNSEYQAGVDVGSYGAEIGIVENGELPISMVVATVHDKDNMGKVDYINNNYVVGGNNIYLSALDAKNITINDLLELGKVRAWQIDHYSKETLAVLLESDYKSEVGNYTATFAVNDERNNVVTINIIVKGEDVVSAGDKYILAANNVRIPYTEAVNILDVNEFITLSSANITDKNY